MISYMLSQKYNLDMLLLFVTDPSILDLALIPSYIGCILPQYLYVQIYSTSY